MATRSRIAIENESGIVNSIYCHFDGYVDGVGKTLFNHYDKEKLQKLIELGDISSLGESTEDTVAYCRDRGEDLNSTSYLDVEGLFELGFGSSVEFVYCLNRDGIWLVCEDISSNVAILKEELEGDYNEI
jgi:hypothetical protein